MYRLYEYPPSGNCYKVRLLLHQLEQPFERVVIDTQKNETRTAEFLKLNPNGKVPVLRLPTGELMSESNAMLWYLAEGSDFLPERRLDRALVLQWMFFEQYSHEPFIATLRNWIRYADKAEEHAREIELYRPRGYAALDVMEQHLNERNFLVAEQYTVGDIALFAYTHVADEGGFDLARYPAIGRWLARVASQPRHIPITA